jgi:hypothetical protein
MAILTKGTAFSDGEQVTSAKLNNLVDAAAFEPDAVDGATIQLSAGKIAVKTIQTVNIATAAITSDKLGAGSVTSNSIYAGSVTAGKLATNSVTEANITTSAVSNTKIRDSSISTTKIINGAVTAAKLDGAQTGSAPSYVARAFGVVEIGSSTRTIQSGAKNISSLAIRDSATTTAISFTQGMPNSNYVVIATYQANFGFSTCVSVYEKTTSGFKMKHADDSDGRYIQFVVFG